MADYPALNLLIAGEKLSGDGRQNHDVIDPATGETIGSVPHATTADLDRALEAAERGFKTWRNTSADQRTAILLKAGYGRVTALGLNLLSGLGGLIGALFVYLALNQLPTVLPYVIAFAAGSFLYVAMSDLIPSLHKGHVEVNPVAQVLLISAGLFTLLML